MRHLKFVGHIVAEPHRAACAQGGEQSAGSTREMGNEMQAPVLIKPRLEKVAAQIAERECEFGVQLVLPTLRSIFVEKVLRFFPERFGADDAEVQRESLHRRGGSKTRA